jgi:hypothetical protein
MLGNDSRQTWNRFSKRFCNDFCISILYKHCVDSNLVLRELTVIDFKPN